MLGKDWKRMWGKIWDYTYIIVLVIGLIVIITRTQTNRELIEQNMFIFQNTVDNIDSRLTNMETWKRNIQYDSQLTKSYLWLSTLSEEAQLNYLEWTETHKGFMECEKFIGFPTIRIDIEYYGYRHSPLYEPYLIVSYNRGDMVIDAEGNVTCYLVPILKLPPENISCTELCLMN